MIKTYDNSNQAFAEHTPKIYSPTAGAWIEAPSAKVYDKTEQAWIDKARKYMEAQVSNSFYNNSGNIIICGSDVIHCEVKPTSSSIFLEVILEKEFVNPVITGLFSFGYSDLCPAIASDFRSHACVEWSVRGYSKGINIATQRIVGGNQFAYTTIFNSQFSKTLNGTFDEIRLVCEIMSFGAYLSYGKANTTIDDFSIDGKSYGTKSTWFES